LARVTRNPLGNTRSPWLCLHLLFHFFHVFKLEKCRYLNYFPDVVVDLIENLKKALAIPTVTV
jgi:hypothetical protein